MKHRRKIAALAAVLLVLLLALWTREIGEAPPPGPPEPPSAAPEAEPPRGPAPSPTAPPADPEPLKPAPLPPSEGPGTGAAPAPPAGVRRLDLVLLPKRDPAPAPEIPPVPKDGIRLGGEGGLGPVGWTKWKPVPKKGTAVLAGVVVDAGGRPLAGAEVLRLAPEAGGVEGDVVSFQHVRTVAVTGHDGAFEARDQPAKPARLVANYRRTMNRPRGLLLAGVVPVDPAENGRVEGLQLAVPVNREDFGAVSGRVTDDEGRPLPGVRVFAGWQEARPEPDGTFRLEAVPAGSLDVTVQKHGWRPWREAVTVVPGEEARIEIALVPSAAGNGVLRGRVQDSEGNRVPGVRVWLGGAPNVSRDATADAEGGFEFRRLPEGPGSKPLSVSVMTDPAKTGILPATVQGVSPGDVVVVTVERSVMLRVVVRDAESKAPLPLFNVSLERERVVDGRPKTVPFHTATLHEEDGVWEVPVPKGRLVLFVEAPDRQPVHGAVEIPDTLAPVEVLVEMAR